jgi:adenylyltransferase/sulfurtransferase
MIALSIGFCMDRYHRQNLLPQIGPARQGRLERASALLIGCGALGSVIADQLIRAGVGFMRICDRDLVETTNLQRQVLFDEADVAANAPKAAAAVKRLKAINSTVRIEAAIVDVHAGNIEQLAGIGRQKIDLIFDGTDNVETRYLINDLAVKHSIPWVYGACVGTGGRAMGIVPEASACLRCLFPQPPAAGELATCDTAGVLGGAASVIASMQVAAGMKILFGEIEDAANLISVDLWPVRVLAISTLGARRPECPACGTARSFDFLDAPRTHGATVLCGRDTVQLRPASGSGAVELEALAAKLSAAGQVQRTPYFVRCALRDAPLTLTVFCDGRILVHGTSDLAVARSAAARFVGI